MEMTGPSNFDPSNSRSYGEYTFTVYVLGKTGISVSNALVSFYSPDNYLDYWHKQFSNEPNPSLKYTSPTVIFTYVPMSAGEKLITIISSGLSKSITITVIKKEVRIRVPSIACDIDPKEGFAFCRLEASYLENGVEMPASITVSIDDGAKIITAGLEGNPVTGVSLPRSGTYAGRVVGYFDHYATTPGTKTVTATSNGVTAKATLLIR